VDLRSFPRPTLEKGSVMVEMQTSGICGTDLEKLSGAYTASTILGHEVAGMVSESRSDKFEEGDRVVPHHHVACGKCYFCRSGAETMCEGFRNSNFVPGGFATEFKVPQYNVLRNGVHRYKKMSAEEASFAEPLGCCIRAQNKILGKGGQSRRVKNVLIVGAGPIGLLHMEILRGKLKELNLVAVDVSSTRLAFAQRSEQARIIDARKSEDGNFSPVALRETDSRGFDLVIVATGNPSAFSHAVGCVRKSGVLLLFGASNKGSRHALDLQSMLLKELTLTSSYATTEIEIDEALSMLQRRKINVKKFITAKFPLEKVNDAMQAARSENQVKVIVTS
jgi:L-iditol 2-dehydrogenase